MKKRITSFILAMVILILNVGNSFAYSSSDEKIMWLIENGYVEGRTTENDEKIDYALDMLITRAEMSKMIVEISNLKDLAEKLKGVDTKFKDVKNSHWACGYISILSTNSELYGGRKIIQGYPDGNFHPEKPISYNEMLAMAVRIVKKDLDEDKEKSALWERSYFVWAENEGLLEDLEISDLNDPATRRNAFILIYNIMKANGKTDVDNVDFGEEIGVVSKLGFGKLELNSDSQKTYNITSDTQFTDGTSVQSIFENMDMKGSLVRIISDEDKNILKIIELGNPRDLGLEGRWFDVSKCVVSSHNETYLVGDFFESPEIEVGGVRAKITEDTQIFTSDLSKNAIRKIKVPSQIFDFVTDKYDPIKDVYMGYDNFGEHNEAKVIVFSEVKKFQGKEELRRVQMPVNSNLRFTAQSMIMGYEKTFDLSELPYFPTGYDFSYGDVIRIKFDDYENAKVKVKPQKLIDYSEDNIYEIKEFENGRLILADEHGREFFFDAEVSAQFKRDEVKEGAHVQVLILPPNFIMKIVGEEILESAQSIDDIDIYEILKNINWKKAIHELSRISYPRDFFFKVAAISVVDDDLRGSLPIGFRMGEETGYVDSISGDSVVICDKEDGRKTNFRYYKVSGTDIERINIFKLLGFEIVFDKEKDFEDADIIYNVEMYVSLEKIEEWQDLYDEKRGEVEEMLDYGLDFLKSQEMADMVEKYLEKGLAEIERVIKDTKETD